MVNEKKQFCPILAIVDKWNCNCGASKCAWWVPSSNGGGHCAIQVLGTFKEYQNRTKAVPESDEKQHKVITKP